MHLEKLPFLFDFGICHDSWMHMGICSDVSPCMWNPFQPLTDWQSYSIFFEQWRSRWRNLDVLDRRDLFLLRYAKSR
jgi:hypothetical protein